MKKIKMVDENNVIEAPTKITIAKYKRSSTDNQELTLQDEIIEKEIKRLRENNPNILYEVINFEDFAISGKTTERPSFKKLMELVEKKKVNIIIFTKLDRFSRSLQDLLNITSRLEANNVKFIVVEQSIDTSNFQGKLMFQIIGAFAEFERNIIRERMESGRKRALVVGSKSGKPLHRPKVEIDEDGVRYKFKQGLSMHAIARFYGVSITPIRRILNEGK